MQQEIKFTPENIMSNLDKIGGWSFYHLARIAFTYFHPQLPDFNEDFPEKEAWIMMECEPDTKALMEKYHQRVGYKESDLNPDFVNKY